MPNQLTLHGLNQPVKVRTPQELMVIDHQLQKVSSRATPHPVVYEDGTLVPFRERVRPQSLGEWRQLVEERIARIRANRKRSEALQRPRVVAFLPTFEREDEVNQTIESLLRQTRPIDLIVVGINGPGIDDTALRLALPYAEAFPNVVVERPAGVAGKVNVLNWMYTKYVQFGSFDMVLGVDADVEADTQMVEHLETDLGNRPQAGGVMARYNFRFPEDMKGKSSPLVSGQRHEFTTTTIKHQLKSDTSEILGGQATLFRAEALRQAAEVTYGRKPWDIRSKVEDAELTRSLGLLGYTAATSRKARAWTGLMFTASSWQKQRRKWQDGHLEDLLREFRPWRDRRRWFEQVAMGWNLTIRVLFAALLVTSVILDKFAFHPFWLAPIGLAVVQSLLVAIKIPGRRLGEVVRAILFVPGEIYYLRTLSVWLDSVVLAFLNIKRDGWKNQAKAESSSKKTAASGWVIIWMAVLVPTTGFMLVSRLLPDIWVSNILMYSWWTLTAMTVASVVGMLSLITRTLRHWRTLTP